MLRRFRAHARRGARVRAGAAHAAGILTDRAGQRLHGVRSPTLVARGKTGRAYRGACNGHTTWASRARRCWDGALDEHPFHLEL